MEKKLFLLERMTIKEFAEEHNLVMEIHERTHIDGPERLYAHFEDAEIKEGNCLVGNFGNGSTEEDAINNYAKEISGKRLVIGAYKNRREIIVPILIGETTNGKKKVKLTKFELKVRKMWWDWYRFEGESSMSKYINKNFDKYFKGE